MNLSPSYLEKLETAYHRFMSQGIIQNFLNKNGRVFIATEKLPAEIIEKWLALGHRHFSEKYVQETLVKWPLLRSKFPDIILHQYGHLQSNKLTKALQLYDGLESLDNDRLVKKIAKRSINQSLMKNIWIQVNLGAEAQKSGVLVENLQNLLESCKDHKINIRGLMAIPPKSEEPSLHFQNLRSLADAHGLEECIMGMSQDYAKAIEMGSNVIRIKRALIQLEGIV